jgi:hypothetical protein
MTSLVSCDYSNGLLPSTNDCEAISSRPIVAAAFLSQYASELLPLFTADLRIGPNFPPAERLDSHFCRKQGGLKAIRTRGLGSSASWHV